MVMTMSNNQPIVPREPIVIRGETSKARQRRLDTGWFEKFCPENKSGIDIGCQNDAIHESFRKWDYIFGDGDATFMEGVADESFFTTHCSHVLEHVLDPVAAVRNWYRITQPGGHLIILVPWQMLYECKEELGSRFNLDHKTYWQPATHGAKPHIKGLRQTILEAIPNAEIVSLIALCDGWYPHPKEQHPPGEYSLEAIIRRR